MNIAIDITPLKSAHKHRGTGTYTEQLITALKKYKNQHSYYFFARGQNLLNNIDLIHYPYFDPFFLTLPFIKRVPTVVTVHDLIPLVYPDKFPAGLRGNLKWFIQKASLLGSKSIITDSYASKGDIRRLTGVDADRIHVVYLAPTESFKKVREKQILSRIAKKYHLPQKYLLYVGDINWNKNIVGLLQGFAAFKVQQRDTKLKLVLVGGAFLDKNLPEAQVIHSEIARLRIKEDVILPGYAESQELPVFYSLAAAYIQPSIAEGFGLPILEAMACECPVIAAYGTSLDEIAGPAVRIKPTDASDIARGVHKVLQKKDLQERQLDWIKQFSWEKAARETNAVYERSLAR